MAKRQKRPPVLPKVLVQAGLVFLIERRVPGGRPGVQSGADLFKRQELEAVQAQLEASSSRTMSFRACWNPAPTWDH